MTQEALKLAHWSDCAVHREPAYPNGECDCGGIVTVADYTALSDKYVALSDKYVALKEQHKEQEPVAWLLTDKNINSLQVDSIQRLIDRLNHAHHTDLRVRINGQDEWFQADWLKHMVRGTPPQRTEPVADYIAAKDMLDEQPVPPRTWIGLENAEAGWFCHTDFLNARKYTKKQREYICNQLLSEAQSWDIDQYTRMMHDSTKRPFIGLTDEDMYVVSEEESCSFIAGAKWSEDILKGKNA